MRLEIDGLQFVAAPETRQADASSRPSLTEEEYQLVQQIVECTERPVTIGVAALIYRYRSASGEERERRVSFAEHKERKHALREAVRDARHDHNPEKF